MDLNLRMLGEHHEGLHLILMPGEDLNRFDTQLSKILEVVSPRYIAASYIYRGDDRARINRLDDIARRHDMTLFATNDVLYHTANRRPLQDILTCIREGKVIDWAGDLLLANAERYLKTPVEMCRLFQDWPHAIHATRELADRISFRLTDLRYEYSVEPVPNGSTPIYELKRLTWMGAHKRYPDRIPKKIRKLLKKEFRMIDMKEIAGYFLTTYHIVKFAREEISPPILCQGRGSAANSAICYCLEITSIDPNEFNVLFERFLSVERNEPPDIDIDFEHERREDVIQHIYEKIWAASCRTMRDRYSLSTTLGYSRGRKSHGSVRGCDVQTVRYGLGSL